MNFWQAGDVARLSREEQTRLNDETIAESFINLVYSAGWDAANIAAVARGANVTVGAVYSRSENIAELANIVWEKYLFPTMQSYVNGMMDCSREGDGALLKSHIDLSEDNSRELLVGMSLVLASLFDEELSEVIGRDFEGIVQQFTVPQSSDLTDQHEAAAQFLILSFMFGRLLALMSGEHLKTLSLEEATILSRYIKAPAVPLASHNDQLLVFSATDIPNEELARAVTSTLGKYGYRRATISRIARAAHMTPGVLFAGVESKAALIADASTQVVISPIAMWEKFAQATHNMDSPQQRSRFLQNYLQQNHRQDWLIRLELARISSFIPEFATFKTPPDSLQRTHLAVLLIGCFTPHPELLPFEGSFRSGVAVR